MTAFPLQGGGSGGSYPTEADHSRLINLDYGNSRHTGFQESDATLTAIAGVTTSANSLIYFTGIDTASITNITSVARDLLDDETATAMRNTIGAQTYDIDLDAISGLSGVGFIKRTGDGTASIDTNTYLTGNQSITLSGIISGTGSTSINTTIADNALTIAKTSGLQNTLDSKMETASYPDIVAIEALSGTQGLLKKTAANTWTLDTSTYLTGNQTITLSGAVTGSGSTTISTTLADSGVGSGTYKSVTVNSKGIVTNGTNPTTLAGYGITDGASNVWNNVTGTTQALAVNSNYIANNSSLVTFTFPTVSVIGDMIRIAGAGTGGWRVNQNSGQQVLYGSVSTTSGSTGYVYSNYYLEDIWFLCITANTTWKVVLTTGSPEFI